MTVRTERLWWVERRLMPKVHGGRPCPRGGGLPGQGSGVGREQGQLLRGCPSCWSSRYWRWVCRDCGWATRWVDGASLEDRRQAEEAFTAHRCAG
jgi:hypothetical protein